MTLATQIEAAENAAAQMQEVDEIRQTAAELPVLRAQQEAQREQRQARANLASAEKRAGAIISRTIPEAQGWRQRFDSLCSDLADLIADLPAIESEIFVAGATLSYAADGLRAATTERDYSRGQTGIIEGLPEALQPLPYGIGDVWRSIGGQNTALDLLPQDRSGSLAAEISQIVQRRARTRIYSTRGANQVLRR